MKLKKIEILGNSVVYKLKKVLKDVVFATITGEFTTDTEEFAFSVMKNS
jgi:hypothetical protein